MSLSLNKNKLELKKHIATIHCSNSLSLVQRKISNALLFHAYPELEKKHEHHIEIKHLCQTIGYDSHDYKLIKSALKKLLSTVLEWNVLKNNDTKEQIWTASSILASVSIEGSVCVYAYSHRMKELLFMPSMYGRIDMSTQAKFKSSYALALYENCVRYQDLPQTSWFSMDIFRKLMGVEEGKYKIFRDFKRRIIDKAVDEVNKLSHLVVSPEVKKERRQVVSIRFHIQKKPNALLEMPKEVTQSELSLKALGFDHNEITMLTHQHKKEPIQAALQYIENIQPSSREKIRDIKAYFLSIVKTKAEKNTVTNTVKIYQSTHSPLASKMKRAKCQKQFSEISSVVKASDKVSEINETFELYLKTHFERLLWRYFQKYQYQHIGVQTEFIKFIETHYPEQFVDVE